MDFISLGRANDIGASCHYLQFDGSGVILDVGADPNEDGPASLPDFSPIADHRVDHVFITHAHHDHIGSVPVLNARWPMARMHLTPASRTLTTLMLYASARLQRRKFEEGSSAFPALFDEEDLDDVFDMFCAHPYNQSFNLSSGHAQLHYSGHLLGSAGVLLTTQDQRRIIIPAIPALALKRLSPVPNIPRNRSMY